MLVQTHEKALNAGVMRKLLLCTPAYSAWVCDYLNSVGKNKLVSGVWAKNSQQFWILV